MTAVLSLRRRLDAPAGGCRSSLHARRQRGGQRGFSLLEALVAMTIASMALATLYRTVGQSAKGVMDIDTRVEAAMVARSALASSTFAEDAQRLSAGTAGAWQWRLQVQPDQIPMAEENGRPAPGGPLRAARVTVEVMHEGGGPVVSTWTTWKPYRSAP